LITTGSRRETLLPPPAQPRPRWRWLRRVAPDPSLRIAGPLWLASKIAIFALAWVAEWIMRPAGHYPLGLTTVWQHWDAGAFRSIAEYGYFGGPDKPGPNQAAFFPGYPLLLRGAHVLIPQWVADEVLIATVASFFAIWGLVRLAEDYRAGAGAWAGVFLLAAPAAVFLSVGYSEAPFLALALPAWRAARRGSWIWASLFAAGACALRINGLFLVVGMVLMLLLAGNSAVTVISRRWALTALLTIPLLPVAAYVIYLYERTGDWLAWTHAEEKGWRRGFHDPVVTFRDTWYAAFSHSARTPFAFAFQLELVAVIVLVITVVALLWQRQWPEAAYGSLTATALVAAYWYMSIPRALLLVFPLWCGLARLAQRHRWIGGLWLAASLPLMFTTAMLYFDGRWAG
jgi:hypothetical protein